MAMESTESMTPESREESMALESTDNVESEGAIECGFREAKGILDTMRRLRKKDVIGSVEADRGGRMERLDEVQTDRCDLLKNLILSKCENAYLVYLY